MTLNTVRSLVLVGLMLLAVVPGSAGLIPFDVSVDTTSVAGTSGAVYLQFNPGADSAPASLSITGFNIDGLGVPASSPALVTDGNVTGSLDAPPLVIVNDPGLNDYLHYLTFGYGITFRATFNLPDNLSGHTSGSTFSFGLTAEDGLTPLLTSDPNGFIGQIGYDETGAFTTTVLSGAGSITNVIPEPTSLTLVGLGLAAGFALFVRLRFRQ